MRGAITSITFVFTDGTVRTLPSPEGQGSNGGNQNSQGGNNSSIGWLSDDNGIPCISGTRKSNASTYLPTIAVLAAASAAGDAVAENQNTSQTNGYGGVTSTLTGMPVRQCWVRRYPAVCVRPLTGLKRDMVRRLTRSMYRLDKSGFTYHSSAGD